MLLKGIHVGADEESLVGSFLGDHDFSPETVRALTQDVRRFAKWFSMSNAEPFRVGRVTVRDVTDFKRHLVDAGLAVATINRCLVTVRRFFGWLVEQGRIATNPASKVKQLCKQRLAPKGLERSQVRRLLRETELRGDVRASAILHLMLFTGARVGDVVSLELHDLMLGERSGTALFRHGKGGKERSVPIPLVARRALEAYLESRPPIDTPKVFVGERGALTERGVRRLCAKYVAITGVRFHPHALRHTFAHRFLAENENDLVALAQILGHESIDTTARYTQRRADELADAAERMGY